MLLSILNTHGFFEFMNYHCINNGISKSEAIDLLKNAD